MDHIVLPVNPPDMTPPSGYVGLFIDQATGNLVRKDADGDTVAVGSGSGVTPLERTTAPVSAATSTGNLVISCAKFPELNGVWTAEGESSGKTQYASPLGDVFGTIVWDTSTGGGQTTPCFSLYYAEVCSLWSPFSQDVATPDLCVGNWTEWYPGSGPVQISVTAETVDGTPADALGQNCFVNSSDVYVCTRLSPVKWVGPLNQ